MNKTIKNVLAVLVGALVFYAVFSLVFVIIALLGRVPFLRIILFYPSDAAWSLVVMPVSAAVFASGWISFVIAKNSKPLMALIILFFVCAIILMFVYHAFSWNILIRDIIGIICALIILFGEN